MKDECIATEKEIKRATKGMKIRLSVGHGFITVTQKSLIEFAEVYGDECPLLISRKAGQRAGWVWVYAGCGVDWHEA